MTVKTTSPAGAGSAIALAVWRTMHSVGWARACGDDHERAWLITEAVCDALYALGVQRVPSARRYEALLTRSIRDREIVAGFNGRNYAELARRHKLSSRTVRRIVERHRNRRQHDE